MAERFSLVSLGRIPEMARTAASGAVEVAPPVMFAGGVLIAVFVFAPGGAALALASVGAEKLKKPVKKFINRG